jgi:TP901 family phage tail tape measure protein
MTTLQLKKLGQESFNTANKYGATVEGYLEGVKEMARAGFGEQATSMAEISILAQTAGDMTAELANEYLLATDAAYKLGGNEKKLTEILDGQNQVTNRNAVSMEQLAEVTDSYKIIDSLAYRVIGM